MPAAAALATLPNLLAVLVVALVVLAAAVAAIRRAAGGVEQARVPLAPHHDLRLDVAGPLVLHGEGPRFTTRFRGLAFRLVERTTGQPVAERRLWVRTSVAGWSRVRLALMRFDVERPGVYRLEVGGLVAAPEDARCALVLLPPTGIALPLAIVATVAAGALTVATLVAIGWRVSALPDPPQRTAPDAPERAATAVTGAVSGAPSAARSSNPAPAPSASAGRQLRAGAAAAAAATKAVHWEAGALTLRVPTAYVVHASGNELDVRDPARASTFLAGHVVTFPAPITAPMLVGVTLESAAGRVQTKLLEGYAAVRFGGVGGVLTIESRRDGANRMAIWSAYQPVAAGVRNVTVIFGAEAAAFDGLERTALAIFESASFD